jgi:hypothetical protein
MESCHTSHFRHEAILSHGIAQRLSYVRAGHWQQESAMFIITNLEPYHHDVEKHGHAPRSEPGT